MVKAIIAVAFPTPEKGIKNPNMEIEGIVYRTPTTARVGLAMRSYSLIRIPEIPPMMIAIKIAIKEILICSKSSSIKNSLRSNNIFNMF